MKPYDSFNQQNDHNGNERNAHLRNMGNHFMEGAYPLENQMMDVGLLLARPSYGGGQPPPRPPHGGGPPHIAPPLFTPQLHEGMYKASRSFWFYPTYVGYNSVAGYRWRRSQQRWAYYGTDAHEIQYFHCY
ncbi:hypothetical protein [Peribacillus frigoritolerans]|uniref:hypothetical protein n=1 Tax=Peribacillus frigoritolerans TaxID=450367 RepID=UPI002E1FCB7A|nr:hypothetical protein [Peribacillus frigoritolerans]MED3847849.1 hypothetical protein [Peribacillus frigoritolerans]